MIFVVCHATCQSFTVLIEIGTLNDVARRPEVETGVLMGGNLIGKLWLVLVCIIRSHLRHLIKSD